MALNMAKESESESDDDESVNSNQIKLPKLLRKGSKVENDVFETFKDEY